MLNTIVVKWFIIVMLCSYDVYIMWHVSCFVGVVVMRQVRFCDLFFVLTMITLEIWILKFSLFQNLILKIEVKEFFPEHFSGFVFLIPIAFFCGGKNTSRVDNIWKICTKQRHECTKKIFVAFSVDPGAISIILYFFVCPLSRGVFFF